MSEFRVITEENVPRWYQLRWLPRSRSLRLEVHQECVERFRPIPETAPAVVGPQHRFGFNRFIGSLDDNFGFDLALLRQPPEGDFVPFHIPLPQVRRFQGICEECGGSGRNKEFDMSCRYCFRGQKYEFDWKPVEAISASLGLFCLCVDLPDFETSYPHPQLMTFSLDTSGGMNGYSLAAKFSIPLVNWLRRLNQETPFPDLVEAMAAACSAFFIEVGHQRGYLRAQGGHNNGTFGAHCDRDCCCIGRDGGWNKPNKGYEITSHNLDSPMNQITFVVALAALQQRVDHELFGLPLPT